MIDGLDGLSGGIFATIFATYSGIAYFQNQIDLHFVRDNNGWYFGFSLVQYSPARFYMGETGVLGLTTALTAVAFLTDTVAVLPIIAFHFSPHQDRLSFKFSKIFWQKVFKASPFIIISKPWVGKPTRW